MRRFMLMVTVLATGALALGGAAAEEKAQAQDDMKVTGMVTEVDKDTNEITVDDETFVMPDSAGGASVMPQVGAEITLFYREEGDEKLITRIGQAQE
jgi:Cu/Ag efflux protein CusF